ncbi:DUF6879 family protein [Nocardia bovistercoris]|uniref:DUF6879 domain-containing protein n=1 Tax=Nocardia bovistercoris TaxID=2785916 RepID=A0A931IF45_9NOCA|nr:DUF6879 family protein [Nocardia bovistercoris]MBH0779398.1 hypothetical protein [Nocardia bovistercoris]
MYLLAGDQLDELFRSSWQRAFHLELQDAYAVSSEFEPLRQFLAGEPEDTTWQQGWLDLIHEITDTGKKVQRVRVVTEPHTDYTRWALSVSPRNIAAGEDIRWLPRHQIAPSDLTGDDYWLFDDHLAAFSVFTPSGEGTGFAVTTDPVIAEHFRTVRDRVWQAAVPHDEYGHTLHQ